MDFDKYLTAEGAGKIHVEIAEVLFELIYDKPSATSAGITSAFSAVNAFRLAITT